MYSKLIFSSETGQQRKPWSASRKTPAGKRRNLLASRFAR
jgi:hypothetical protein